MLALFLNQEWPESAMANDAELCECLVELQDNVDEQPNTDNTFEPVVANVANLASCTDVSNTHVNTPAIVANDIPMDCSDINDPLLTAIHKHTKRIAEMTFCHISHVSGSILTTF